MDNFFHITMYISVVLVYLLGIIVLIGLTAKLSMWTLDKMLVSMEIRQLFVEFMTERKKTPKGTVKPAVKEELLNKNN